LKNPPAVPTFSSAKTGSTDILKLVIRPTTTLCVRALGVSGVGENQRPWSWIGRQIFTPAALVSTTDDWRRPPPCNTLRLQSLQCHWEATWSTLVPLRLVAVYWEATSTARVTRMMSGCSPAVLRASLRRRLQQTTASTTSTLRQRRRQTVRLWKCYSFSN